MSGPPTEVSGSAQVKGSGAASPGAPSLETLVQSYGDLLFDLCESVLWSPVNAQVAFRAMVQEIRRSQKNSVEARFERFERAWVLRLACDRLRSFADRHARRITPSEQLELDSQNTASARLHHFDHYFHRLSTEDQLLLLLKDKHGLPLTEIEAALGAPSASLKIRHQQALRALEEWIWDTADGSIAPSECFKWHTRASDILGSSGGAESPGEETIPARTAELRAAEAHLRDCGTCGERFKHYRLLLNTLAHQPRSTLPVPIRKAPLAASLPRLDMSAVGRSRWESLPWYVRTAAEATGIISMILIAIVAAPRLRNLYNQATERRLSEFAELFRRGDLGTDEVASLNVPASARGKVAGADGADFETEGEDEEATPEEEVSEDPKESVSFETETGEKIRVGNSEIWRFSLKTDSPAELRPKIVEAITSLRVAEDTPGIGGIEAPGGIQFDLIVPKGVIPALRGKLQKLAPKAPPELASSPAGTTFTWYKNRSKRPIPSGKTRIVIWISQM